MTDALQLLRDDHKKVKELFNQFEDAEDNATKGRIAKEALRELEIHAEIEEKIFYPAVRKEADTEDDMMDEAEEEHHVVKLLIAELHRMRPEAPRFAAKFTVLSENVRHHIDEEESEMLPKAAELGMERMNELGMVMGERKAKLEGAGVGGARAGSARTGSTRRASTRKVGARTSAASRNGRSAAGPSASRKRATTSQAAKSPAAKTRATKPSAAKKGATRPAARKASSSPKRASSAANRSRRS